MTLRWLHRKIQCQHLHALGRYGLTKPGPRGYCPQCRTWLRDLPYMPPVSPR